MSTLVDTLLPFLSLLRTGSEGGNVAFPSSMNVPQDSFPRLSRHKRLLKMILLCFVSELRIAAACRWDAKGAIASPCQQETVLSLYCQENRRGASVLDGSSGL